MPWPAPGAKLSVAAGLLAILPAWADMPARPPRTNQARMARVASYLQPYYCAELIEQPINRSRQKNLACVLPGKQDSRLVIGTHYDRTGGGRGVADNWSGIVTLTRLLAHHANQPRYHTLEFVAFGEEETGTLRVDRRSDTRLKHLFRDTARILALPAREAGLRDLESDWIPFQRAGVPVLAVHSINHHTQGILHQPRDRRAALDRQALENADRLLFAVLARLNQPVFGTTAR